MTTILLAAALFSVPINLFMMVTKVTGPFWFKVIFKSFSFMSLMLVLICALNYFGVI